MIEVIKIQEVKKMIGMKKLNEVKEVAVTVEIERFATRIMTEEAIEEATEEVAIEILIGIHGEKGVEVHHQEME